MPLSALVTDVLGRLLHIAAPARCLGCLQEQTWLCPNCRNHIGVFPLACIGCGKANPRGLTCEVCRRTTALTGVVSVGSYRHQLLQRGIGWLKYKGVTAVAPILATLLLPRLLAIAPWQELQQKAMFIPLPLHPRRQRERGFNQSAKIAAALSDATAIPVVPLLTRPRATWTQSHLPHDLRQHNVQTAFGINGSLPHDRTIAIIIDDVTTTGATLSAAAQPLKKAGVPMIWGATIARG